MKAVITRSLPMTRSARAGTQIQELRHMIQQGNGISREVVLAQLMTANEKSDAAAMGTALIDLVKLEPNRWREIILLNGIVPDANSREWQKRLPVFLDAIRQVVEANVLSLNGLDAAARTLVALLDIGQRLERIGKRLNKGAFFTRSKATQIYRLAIWLESQSTLVHEAIAKVAVSGKNYDPVAAVQTSLSAPGVSGSVSPVRSWENMVDAAELVLRYVMWRQAKAQFGTIDYSDSPYEAPDFEEVTRLSTAWQDLESIWADVKFNGWLPEMDKDVIIFVPPDQDDLRRRFVSIVRQDRFVSQEVSRWMNEQGIPSNDERAVRKLVRTVRVPPRGQVWKCGEVDPVRLNKASKDTRALRIARFHVDHRHFKALVNGLAKGMGPAGITWEQWLTVRNVLAVTCQVYFQAVQDQVRYEDGKRERSVVPVKTEELAAFIADATGLSGDQCRACIELMTFGSKYKGLDLFDQPLLPVADDVVLLVPCLVANGNPVYSLEHFVGTFGIGSFSSRGIPFEQSMADELKAKGVPAKADVWAQLQDGRRMNYDTVCWWMGYLILIEAKCVKTEFSSADDFNTRSAVDESIDQLIRRRDSLKEYWEALRAAAPELKLPAAPPPPDRVLYVSVTNSMRFSGLVRSGVVCTDDFCLLKYFGSAMSPVYELNGNTMKGVGMVRNRPDVLGPLSWMNYLRNPPQIRSLDQDVKITLRDVMRLPDDPSTILVPHYSYSGSTANIVHYLKGGFAKGST
ncbi:MAG TPA: hypothetical protein VGN12_19495 [Pirellulales bacterium]